MSPALMNELVLSIGFIKNLSKDANKKFELAQK